MTRRRQTPSQTVGPFFHDGLLLNEVEDIAAGGVGGRRIRLEGRILDGAGDPVDDAMVEVWQADGDGRYRHPLGGGWPAPGDAFIGFGRVASGAEGRYGFETVVPGPVAAPAGGTQAPHLNLQVFARGLLTQLFTRVYFEGEAANDDDPVLAAVAPGRRETLIARPADRQDPGGPACYRFDIVLQGEGETVFFDV